MTPMEVDRSVRLRGAAIAAALWLPLAALMASPQDPRGVALAMAGLCVAPIVGWLVALQARSSTGLGLRTALLFAGASVALGTPVWGLTFAVLDRHEVADALGFAAVGLIFLGVPVLMLGTLAALVWIPLVRRSHG